MNFFNEYFLVNFEKIFTVFGKLLSAALVYMYVSHAMYRSQSCDELKGNLYILLYKCHFLFS